MKYLKAFVYLTTALSLVGCLALLNEGNFDIYALWNVCALILASYYLAKN